MPSNYNMPLVLTDIPEVKCCYDIAAEMTELYYTELSRLDNERNTDTATEYGISRKEKMYGIRSYETDTLEERRLRIKIHEHLYKTLNVYNFKNTLNLLTGGDTTVEIDKKNKSVLVNVGLSSLKMLLYIKELIKAYLPVDWSGAETVLYNKFSKYGEYTFAELSEKTFNELMKEV